MSLINRLYKGKGNFKSMIDKFDANSSRELKALENNKVIDVDGERKKRINQKVLCWLYYR